MELKDLQELVNHRLITEVGYYDHYKKNESELSELTLDKLANTGLLKQPAITEVLVEKGISILPNNMIATAADLLAELNATGYAKLTNDITLDDYIEIRNEAVIDLNGYTILHPKTSPSKYPDVFEVMTGGKLTIEGEGKVIAENGYAVYAAGDSVVTINGGEYFSPVSVVDARKNASVTINAGTFKVDGSNNADGDFGQKFTLNLRDKVGNYASELSEIIVKGGKFWKYNPAASESEPEITNFVADGYEVVVDGDWFVVEELEGIVVDDNQ